MAGAGIKIFTNAEVLSADEINSYLMDQAVAVFETPEDRTFAFGTGIGGDNKPVLSEGRTCYVKSTNSLEIYDGSSWQATTSIIGSGAIDSDKIASNAITTDKINNLAVTTGKIDNLSVTEGKIANNAVTASKISTSAISSGLNGGGGTAISVRTDGTSIQINGSNNLEIVPGSTLQLTSSTPSSVGGTTGLSSSTVGVASTAARADHIHAASDTLSVVTVTAPDALIVGNVFTINTTYKDKMIVLNNGSTNLEVRIQAEETYPVGTQIHVQNHGTGQITIVPSTVFGGSASLVCTPATGANNAKLRAQYSAVTLIKLSQTGSIAGSNLQSNWTAVGDVTA